MDQARWTAVLGGDDRPTDEGEARRPSADASEIATVRAGPRAVSELSELLARKAVRGLVLDLTRDDDWAVALLEVLRQAGTAEPLPVVAVARPHAPVGDVAWATVPCPPGGETPALERARRICLALARDAASYADLERSDRALRTLCDALDARADGPTREAMLVHDLRSPLGVLRGALELLTDDGDPPSTPERRALGALAHRATAELTRIVERLEALYAREREPSERELVDLGTLAREVADGLRCSPASQGRELRVNVRGRPWIVGDRHDLARALGNLLENALRHAERAVDVHIEGDADELTVSVRDDGPGIAPHVLDRLFERYVQGQSAGRMGLGLAIVRQIAERHGGEALAFNLREREPRARGACFVLRLPTRG
ncbi:MAG TPA: HAMP domain-containing sensor histidine kinase [Sandaracinaceae bacterium]